LFLDNLTKKREKKVHIYLASENQLMKEERRKEIEEREFMYVSILFAEIVLNLLSKSIYDEQLMDQLHHILVLRSTFVERLKVKPKLNHQSILNIYVQVGQ